MKDIQKLESLLKQLKDTNKTWLEKNNYVGSRKQPYEYVKTITQQSGTVIREHPEKKLIKKRQVHIYRAVKIGKDYRNKEDDTKI